MAQRGWAVPVIVLGVLLVLLSLFADALGVGGKPGFGWKQTAGLVVGVVLMVLGWWRRR